MSKYSNQVWLKKWISGDLTRTEEAELWKLAESDPFLADALAGLESQPEVNHALNLSNIEVQLAKRASQRSGASVIDMVGHQKEAKVVPMGSWRRVAAIAALLVIGLTGIWFIGNMNNSLDTVAMENAATKPETNKSMDTPEPVREKAMVEMENDETEEGSSETTPQIPSVQKEVKTSAQKQTKTKKKATALKEKKAEHTQIAQLEEPVVQPDLAAAPPAIAPEPYEATTARIEPAPRMTMPIEETDQFNLNEQADAAIIITNTVQGVVKDENNEPLIGVSIIEKGTNNGTVTDFDGSFSFELEKEDADLEIKYTGFQSETIPVQSVGTPIDITLEQSDVALDEVVVTGMAIKRKRSNMAASTATVDKEKTRVRGNKKQQNKTAKPAGGFKKFEKYIKKNLQYPEAARAIGYSRIVSLSFQLDANGMPTNIIVTNPSADDLGFEKEAVRLLKEGGKWIGNTEERISYDIQFSL